MGCIFIISSLAKFISIDAFSEEIALYVDAYFSYWMVNLRIPIAVGVCMIELVVGILAFFDKLRLNVSILFFLIMSFFLCLTGMNYLAPPISGSIETCGCFGELISFSADVSFYKNIILWLMTLCCVVSVFNEKALKKYK